jgi:hypothetical protein
MRVDKYKKHLRKNPHLGRSLEQIESLEVDKGVLEETAWYVLAPTMHMFVIWVLQQAVKKNVENLYFLARDAYLMFKIAQKICEEMELPLKCHYFYCSRFSLRTPLFHFDIDQALDYICANGLVMNLKVILERTGLSEVQQEEVMKCLKTDFQPDEDIPFSRLGEVRQSLRECQLFIEYLTDYSKGLTPGLMSYLEQEGLLDNTVNAIVDSGWVGSTQRTINKALGFGGADKDVMGFYWGLYDLPVKTEQKNYHTYYFCPGKSIKEKIHFSSSLFEAIFSAPHGTTTGYQLTEEATKPIYSQSQQEKIDFIQRIDDVLMEYTDLFIQDIDNIEEIDVEGARKIIYHILKLFMTKPSSKEANYFGDLIFSGYIEEDGTQRIAAKFNKEDMKGYQLIPRVLTMLGLKHGRVKESGWPEGSIVLYGGWTRYHLLQSALYKRLSYTRMMMMWRLRKE